MAHKKLDGVIEAVRYTLDGSISVVRSYQRHGSIWSDRILLDRPDLVELLKNGKSYVIGARKAYLGGVFKAGPAVHFTDEHIVTEGQAPLRDMLAGVPLF